MLRTSYACQHPSTVLRTFFVKKKRQPKHHAQQRPKDKRAVVPRALTPLDALEHLHSAGKLTPLRLAFEIINYFHDLRKVTSHSPAITPPRLRPADAQDMASDIKGLTFCELVKSNKTTLTGIKKYVRLALKQANPYGEIVEECDLPKVPAEKEVLDMIACLWATVSYMLEWKRQYGEFPLASMVKNITKRWTHKTRADVCYQFFWEVLRKLHETGGRNLHLCQHCSHMFTGDQRRDYCGKNCQLAARQIRHKTDPTRLEYQAVLMFIRSYCPSHKGVYPKRSQIEAYVKRYRARREQKGLSISRRTVDKVVEQASARNKAK